MDYRKIHSKSYNPHIIQLNIDNYSIQVNYSEITNESCLEFNHVHIDYEIYYCLEGVMHLMIGDECIEMGCNTFSIIGPGVYHHTLYEPKTPKRYFIFVFEEPVYNKNSMGATCGTDQYVDEVIKYIEKNKNITCNDKCNCETIIRFLEQEMETDQPGQEDMIRAFYGQYLVHIFRNLKLSPESYAGDELRNQGNINLALELTQYMHENYNKNINIKDAAKAFHISERHVGRIFDKYFGTTFKHTLNIYRINYAKNYLLDTDYSIEKIASLVGISSTRKFHQLFREMEQMSVNEYRDIHRDDVSHYGVINKD